MRQLSTVTAKATRHRKYHWCRRPNGFSDLPIWRVVASECDMPVFQVIAFVNRLEELANNAANFGLLRGSVERFMPAEFGAALGMTTGDAAKLFAALEDTSIGWVVEGHIADFYDRNPDQEENAEDVRQRKRRERWRKAIVALLARLRALGKIEEGARRTIELTLKSLSDAELENLKNRLSAAELSTSRECHVVTSRDIVTVTTEQTKFKSSEAVDNSGDNGGGQAESFATNKSEADAASEATAWVDTFGRKMLVEYIQIPTTLAETYIERWRRDLQDDSALAEIMKGAEGAGYIGARFHTLITDQLKRFIARREHGPSLPLMPPRPQTNLKRTGYG